MRTAYMSVRGMWWNMMKQIGNISTPRRDMHYRRVCMRMRKNASEAVINGALETT